jgi:hypothetical protein
MAGRVTEPPREMRAAVQCRPAPVAHARRNADMQACPERAAARAEPRDRTNGN